MPTCQQIEETISPYFQPLIVTGNGKGNPGQVPGILVGVTYNGAHCYYSFGSVQTVQTSCNNPPSIENTVMFIGSNTKVVTATLLALACYGQAPNKQLVNGFTEISSLVPSIVKPKQWYSWPIRLWHLATHSAGYPDGPCGKDPFGNYSFDSTTDFLNTFQPKYCPGLYWHYSNQGFALLGALMSFVFNGGGTPPGCWSTLYQDWPTVATKQVLAPLGMTSTQTGYNNGDMTQLAQSYGYNKGAYPPIDTPTIVPTSAAIGAGALTSTLADMLTFLDNQITPPTSTLPSLADAITLTQKAEGQADYDLAMGMAWQIGNGYFEKNGLVLGFSTYMAFDPTQQYGIFAMANSRSSDDGGSLVRAGRTALGDLRGTKTTPPPFNTTQEIPHCP